MIRARSCRETGVIAIVEQFTYCEPALRLYCVYTYYDRDGKVLWVGATRNFYETHCRNLQERFFAGRIVYIGFAFLQSEEELRDVLKYYVRARHPLYNREKYEDVPFLKGLGSASDDLVVSNRDMLSLWDEWTQEEIGECGYLSSSVSSMGMLRR